MGLRNRLCYAVVYVPCLLPPGPNCIPTFIKDLLSRSSDSDLPTRLPRTTTAPPTMTHPEQSVSVPVQVSGTPLGP